jgi:NhaP-type Na+/H+ or K+/H+ antiporter
VIPLLVLAALAGLMQAARSFAPDAVSAGGTELAFGFLLLTAYFTGKLFNRVGLPKLTGYIASGIIVGPYVLELVDKNMTGQLKLVSGVTTSILALTAGAELNLRKIKPLLGTVRSVAVYAVFGTMVVLTAHAHRAAPAGAVPLGDADRHAAAVAMTMASRCRRSRRRW